jgi:hypothetical protein
MVCTPTGAVAAGFEHADFVILLEDDVLMAKDALVWMEHARNLYGDDKDVFDVSAYSDNCHKPDQKVDAKFHFMGGKRRHFTPWMWGIWRNRYDEFKKDYLGWDLQMNVSR